MKILPAISILVTLLLAGCASPYHPYGLNGGYSETAVTPEVERVFFHGNDYTSAEQTQDYAMLRAAEISLEKGCPYFVVLDETTEKTPEATTTPPTLTETVPPTSGISSNEYYSGYTTFDPGKTTDFYKPKTGLLVQFFKTKPVIGFAYNAANFAAFTKAKYGLK